jgi:hypothetical protein
MPTIQRLTAQELRNRLQLDYRVCYYMFGFNTVLSGEAYQSTEDMERRRNVITSPDRGYLAKRYRVDFHVKTLIGPGQFAEVTTIGFDLDMRNYPYEEPATWIISSHVPYSPHFKRRTPICIGEIWQRSNGHMLLGQLFVHIAKLLNWDERIRNNYTGWNPEAIEYHNQFYQGRPINAGLQYPMLPPDLHEFDMTTSSQETPTPLFRSLQAPTSPLDASKDLFKGKGIV